MLKFRLEIIDYLCTFWYEKISNDIDYVKRKNQQNSTVDPFHFLKYLHFWIRWILLFLNDYIGRINYSSANKCIFSLKTSFNILNEISDLTTKLFFAFLRVCAISITIWAVGEIIPFEVLMDPEIWFYLKHKKMEDETTIATMIFFIFPMQNFLWYKFEARNYSSCKVLNFEMIVVQLLEPYIYKNFAQFYDAAVCLLKEMNL